MDKNQIKIKTPKAALKFVMEDNLIIFGGDRKKFGTTNETYMFKTKNRTWEKLETNEKVPVSYYPTSVLYNDSMYVFGGNDHSSIFELNLKNLEWNEIQGKGQIPKSRMGHTALVHENEMFVFGGINFQENINNGLFAFDFRSATWNNIPDPQEFPGITERISHTSKYDPKSKRMIVFGGGYKEDGEDKDYNDICIFNFVTRNWEKRFSFDSDPNAPCGRNDHSAVLLNNKMMIFFGCAKDNTIFFDDIYSFQFGSDLSVNMHSFFDDQLLCDIDFVPFEGKSIQAHKDILEARITEPIDTLEREIGLLDHSESRCLLTYIYSGSFEPKSIGHYQKIPAILTKIGMDFEEDRQKAERKLSQDLQKISQMHSCCK
ncbi:hypothetical protein M0811_14757 [Anaeramoeba ignava]|uniref:Attractin/MKLN-like beta-propeller domain-containing protein n=1 Tax=Anaeramoeba ignava TaxID=1746090 RepID=A0A9Q0RG29_ANAIG|nr:hypothetical protein M0811_14757 [Anaeramoeba ignava]